MMNTVYICFGLASHIDCPAEAYEDVYKHAVSFFYSHPGWPFFFVFSGPQTA